MEKLDKYYTKTDVALYCWNKFRPFLKKHKTVIEPSAGDGKLLDVIDNTFKKIAFDIKPEREDIIECDFVDLQLNQYIKNKNTTATFMNPPFGKKSELAILFLNKCLQYSNIVGIIAPKQFRKYSVHTKIDPNSKLILDIDLDENGFTSDGKDFSVRCVFQIWTTMKSDTNMRIQNPPKTTHPDFEMWQYNATSSAEKFFNYDWDFAVLRQGYGDFNKLYKRRYKSKLSRKKQWMFIKAYNDEVLDRLRRIDYNKLSENNTSVRGFGKHDLVEEYTNIYGEEIFNGFG